VPSKPNYTQITYVYSLINQINSHSYSYNIMQEHINIKMLYYVYELSIVISFIQFISAFIH